eukprot:scaffold19666_cov65-Phaeocystis_antarctica.AAC.8
MVNRQWNKQGHMHGWSRTGHAVHWLAPSERECVPGGHRSGSVEAVGQYSAAGQIWHCNSSSKPELFP